MSESQDKDTHATMNQKYSLRVNSRGELKFKMPESQDKDKHTTMNENYILYIPYIPLEVVSTFTPPIFIEMGEEGGGQLESIVKEKTGEIVKADKDWTHLPSTRSIDASVVGGFMFQTDAGSGCWIEMTANGSVPIQILIDREQDFSMFLVVVLPHEKWTTSGDFYLRFLRRIAVSDQPCTARPEGPFAGPVLAPSDTAMSSSEEPMSSSEEPKSSSEETKSSSEEPGSSTTNSMNFQNKKKQVSPYRPKSTSTSPSAQAPSDVSLEDASRTDSSETTDEELTDYEDWRSIGAAALRARYLTGTLPGTLAPDPE